MSFDFGFQDNLLPSRKQSMLSELNEFEPDMDQNFVESPAPTTIISN